MSYAQFQVGDEVQVINRYMNQNWVGTIGFVTRKTSDRVLHFQPTSGPGFGISGPVIKEFLASVTTLEFVSPEASDIPEPNDLDII